jgi:soluble lytic murein transglycosylase-like protein
MKNFKEAALIAILGLTIVIAALWELEANADTFSDYNVDVKSFRHSSDLDRTFEAAANTNQIPVKVLRGVCWVESHHDPKAFVYLDPDRPSYGICQIQYPTAVRNGYRGDVTGLMYAPLNIYLAAHELRRWYKISNGNFKRAVSSYNRGYYSKAFFNEYIARVIFAIHEGR